MLSRLAPPALWLAPELGSGVRRGARASSVVAAQRPPFSPCPSAPSPSHPSPRAPAGWRAAGSASAPSIPLTAPRERPHRPDQIPEMTCVARLYDRLTRDSTILPERPSTSILSP